MRLTKYEKNTRWRKKNKAFGLCPRCGKKPETGGVHCIFCREKKRKLDRAYWSRRKRNAKDKGVCWKCGNLYIGNMSLCEICNTEWNRYQVARYVERAVGVYMEEEFLATLAHIGSKEKVDVMAKRYDDGQPLFHPEDSRVWEKLVK